MSRDVPIAISHVNNAFHIFRTLNHITSTLLSGIHLEKDMSVPFGHTVARTVCLFEILCAPKSVECAFFEIVRDSNKCNEMY